MCSISDLRRRTADDPMPGGKRQLFMVRFAQREDGQMTRSLTGVRSGLGKRLGFVLVAVLAIGLGTASADAQSGQAATLAVLPLENSSGDAAQDFFAGGMTDEIAVALAGVRGLGVVARSSSFALKPSDRDSQVAGRALNASHIVHGT